MPIIKETKPNQIIACKLLALDRRQNLCKQIILDKNSAIFLKKKKE